MTDEAMVQETVIRLNAALKEGRVPDDSFELAEKCFRRLDEPLKVTIFGTDGRHAMSLLNLMAGQSLVSTNAKNLRVQAVYSDRMFAIAKYADGEQETVEGDAFTEVFEKNPVRVRVAADLPALRKITITAITHEDPEQLCEDVNTVLQGSGVVLWAGDSLDETMLEVWSALPQDLHDHSYLVLSPRMDLESWASVKNYLADDLTVDARLALVAKEKETGVDKDAFRAAGGTALVRAMKHEIDFSLKSAFDAAQIILAKTGDAAVSAPVVPKPAAKPRTVSTRISKTVEDPAPKQPEFKVVASEPPVENVPPKPEQTIAMMGAAAAESLLTEAEEFPGDDTVYNDRPTSVDVEAAAQSVLTNTEPTDGLVSSLAQKATNQTDAVEGGDMSAFSKRPTSRVRSRPSRASTSSQSHKKSAGDTKKKAKKKAGSAKAKPKAEQKLAEEKSKSKRATPWSMGL